MLLELSLHCLAGLGCGHLLIGDDVLELQIILDDESGGEEMVVVDELDEGLEPALSIDFLLVHALGDLSGGTLNSDDEGVGELIVLRKVKMGGAITFFPSSFCFTMTAFLPALLPASRMTTLPFLMLNERNVTIQLNAAKAFK